MMSQSRSHTEHSLTTDNIIVLDCYFNLTYKSNLIDRLSYSLIRFFDNMVVA